MLRWVSAAVLVLTFVSCGRDQPVVEPTDAAISQMGAVRVGQYAVVPVGSFRVSRPATLMSVSPLDDGGAAIAAVELVENGESGFRCAASKEKALVRPHGRVEQAVNPVRGARLEPGRSYGVTVVVAVDRVGTWELSGARLRLSDGQTLESRNMQVTVEGVEPSDPRACDPLPYAA